MENKKEPKILFEFQSRNIDSVLVFKDGDFIIFITNTPDLYKNNYSVLYDAKTFQEKQKFDVSSISCFYYLTEDEYGIYKDDKFEIYFFKNQRKESKLFQTFHLKNFSSAYKLSKLSNGDLLMYSYYLGRIDIEVYRKNNSDYSYILKYEFQTHCYDEIIEINNKELLGYKKSFSPDSLILKVLNNEDYTVLRENTINYDINDPIIEDKKHIGFKTTGRKRIYLLFPLYKVSEKKIITAGINRIFIFETDTLQLETVIQLSREIIKLLIRPKGNIFCICVEKTKNAFEHNYFLNNINIDYRTNSLILNEENNNINDKVKQHGFLFQLYNYINNGFITVVDKKEMIIYDSYYD